MLIKEALSILTSTNEKIQLLGVEIIDLEGSPKQPRIQTQINDLVARYTMLLQHIILNDDGDEILGTIGQNDDDLNAILIDLQSLADLNELPGLPIPRTTYVTSGSGTGSGLPSSGSLGDLLYFNGTEWINFNRGASGEVLVSTPTTIQWQSVIGNGIPSGGSAGQFLRKNSNTSYDVVWAGATLVDVGVTASSAEVNVLDGITASTSELNLLTGLTGGSLQTQLAAKLSNSLPLANMWVGNGSGIATAFDTSSTGDILAHSVNGLTIKSGVIDNNDINTSAAISRSKLASGSSNRLVINDGAGVMDVASGITPNRALVSNGSGIPIASSVTDTKLAFVDATSSIQTQLNNKLSFNSSIIPSQGNLIYFNGSVWTNLAIGTTGQILTTNGTDVMWGSGVANGLPVGGSANQILRKIDGTNYNTEWHTLATADITDLSVTFTELNQLSGVSVTPTEFNTLSGINSSIQAQIDAKLSRSLAYNAIFVGNISAIASQLSAGSNGDVLTVVGGTPTWNTPSAPGDVSGPVSSTDRAIATWNGTAGDTLRDTSVLIDASNNITGVTSLSSGQVDILNQAELRLHETGSTNYVGLRATGVMAGNYVITLPAAAPASNTFLKYDGVDYVWGAGGGGASDFIDLGDVPSSYTGEGGKFVAVKVAEDGLEFVAGVGSVTGTSNRITISGTAINPVVDIASTYIGQATITTLGTIATGVWNATNISLAKGGTGASLTDPGADRILFWDDSGSAIDWLSIDSTLSISGTTLSSVFGDEQAQDAVGNILTNTTTINLTYNDGLPSISAIVNDNSISDTKIRQSVALSVIGRSANSTGDVGDIAAGANFNILRRSGTSIGFGSIDLSQSGAVGSSILPIANGGTGVATGAWLLASGATLSAANTITANTANFLTFNGTWTASATGQKHILFGGTLTNTASASDSMFGYSFAPTLNTGAATQVLTAVDINPTYGGANVATAKTYSLRIQGNGSVLINGGTSTSTASLIVQANTVTATAAIAAFRNNSDVVVHNFINNSSIQFTGITYALGLSTDVSGSYSTSGTVFQFGAGISTSHRVGFLFSNNGNVFTDTTSGENIFVRQTGNMTAASGTAKMVFLAVEPTVHQSGSASGAMTGIRYQVNGEVLGIHYAIITGSGLHGFGVLTPTAKVQIKGEGTGTAKTLLLEDSAGTDRFGFQDNGVAFFYTAPSNNNALTQVLVRDGSTGEIKYRAASALLYTPDVTSGTVDDVNLYAGVAGGTATAGGRVYIQGSTSNVTGVKGGDVRIVSGQAFTGNANGGDVYIDASPGIGSGVAGNLYLLQASGKLSFFAVTPVTQQSGLTTITHTAPGTPDYALQDLTAGGFGFATKDEGNTLLSVVKQMQVAFKNYGLLS